MKLKSRYAVISFCPDLTDPSASSVPVAVLLIAEASEGLFAAALARGNLKVDAITAEFLHDVPRLLKDHIESVDPDAHTPETLLHKLHDSLRNSLHVAKISEPRELDFSDDRPIESQFGRMLDAAQDVLKKELESAGEQTDDETIRRARAAFEEELRGEEFRNEFRRAAEDVLRYCPERPAIAQRHAAMPDAATIWRLGGGDKCGSGAPVN